MVATVDVDEDARRATGVRQEPAVEDVEGVPVAAGGERARGPDGKDRETNESDIEKLPSHDDSFLVVETLLLIVAPGCQAAITRS
jgi:hypothetical protein